MKRPLYLINIACLSHFQNVAERIVYNTIHNVVKLNILHSIIKNISINPRRHWPFLRPSTAQGGGGGGGTLETTKRLANARLKRADIRRTGIPAKHRLKKKVTGQGYLSQGHKIIRVCVKLINSRGTESFVVISYFFTRVIFENAQGGCIDPPLCRRGQG